MELTPEERQKIYLEEKARLEVQQDLRLQGKKTNPGTVFGWVFLGGIGLLVLIFLFGSIAEKANKPTDSSSTTSPDPALKSTGNVAHDKLLTFDSEARAAALGLIVVSSGIKCKGKDAFFMGLNRKDNEANWSIRCTNGKGYQVGIKANATGSTSVIDCAALKAVADVDCFVKLDEQNRPPRTKKQIKADINRLSPALKKEMSEQLRKNLRER